MDTDKSKIEEITKVVLEVIKSQSEINKKQKSPWERRLSFCYENKILFVILLTIISALIGWVAFGISPFHSLQEIAHNQKDYKRKEERLEFEKKIVDRHLYLANLFMNGMDIDKADTEYEHVLKLDPDNIEAHLGKLKTEVFLELKKEDYNPEITEMRLRLLQRERPDDPHIFTLLGAINSNVNKDSAIHFYEKAIAKDSTVSAAFEGLAELYDKDKKQDSALFYYEKASNISKWNQGYLNNIAYQHYQRNDFEKAIEKYKSLLKLNDRFLLSYYTLSNSYRIKGNLDSANYFSLVLRSLLDSSSITSLKINNNEWFFHTDNSETISFFDMNQKKCYAYYSAALTNCLFSNFILATFNQTLQTNPQLNMYAKGLLTEADQLVAKAKILKIPNEEQVRDLVKYDIRNLQQKQAAYTNALNSFKTKYNFL
jgi:tetratricopeptide (TPR) repeat protein